MLTTEGVAAYALIYGRGPRNRLAPSSLAPSSGPPMHDMAAHRDGRRPFSNLQLLGRLEREGLVTARRSTPKSPERRGGTATAPDAPQGHSGHMGQIMDLRPAAAGFLMTNRLGRAFFLCSGIWPTTACTERSAAACVTSLA